MKKNVRVIPRQNYVILTILVLLVVGLTFVFCNWYKVSQNLNKEDSIMSQFLVSVNEKEFENYIMENNNIIIYLASSKDETINNFEKEFKELIIEHDLQNQMIYIDLDNINKEFIDLLKKSYFEENLKNIDLGIFSNVLIMESGKINAVLYNKLENPTIEDINEFFYNRGVIAQA